MQFITLLLFWQKQNPNYSFAAAIFTPSAVGYASVGAGCAAQRGVRQCQAFPGSVQDPAATGTRGANPEKHSFLLLLCIH